MPIEIRELVIKMTVEEHGHKKADQAPDEDKAKALEDIREDIVRECMDRMFSHLTNSKER